MILLILLLILFMSIAINFKLYMDLRDYKRFADVLVGQLIKYGPEEVFEEVFFEEAREAEIIPFRGREAEKDEEG